MNLTHLQSYMEAGRLEAGCDEAGRGCLAGPVFAAAVILPPDFYHPQLNDSKQLTETQRNTLRKVIEQNALAWSVASLNNEEIDKLNILWASVAAMHLALDGLSLPPQFILVDGNRFKPYKGISHQCIVKGDSIYTSIAAASVLAKTHRDEYMLALAEQFPEYNWAKNKGYPTKAHRNAIRQYGTTPYHRVSFKLLDDQPSLF